MRELVGSKNTIGQMASVLKKLQKATFTFTLGLDSLSYVSFMDGLLVYVMTAIQLEVLALCRV